MLEAATRRSSTVTVLQAMTAASVPHVSAGPRAVLHAAWARVVETTADATFAFFVCTVEPERTGAPGVGTSSPACTSVAHPVAVM